MDKKRPLILISNDDGYHAKGLRSLVAMISDMADILVCAPESARSGFSCAFSAAEPLRLKPRRPIENAEVWSCNGTPVDCVKLAMEQFCSERKPDLIIGGINHGDNASVNTHYSGTMGVTMEGCMKHIPSIAFSLCDHRDDADFSPLRPWVRQIVSRVLTTKLPKNVCLNINFPKCTTFQGVKICRMAHGTWDNECVKMRHPSGYDYFWLVGEYVCDEPQNEDTDHWALNHGYVSITPTRVDVTAYEAMDELKKWQFSEEKA